MVPSAPRRLGAQLLWFLGYPGTLQRSSIPTLGARCLPPCALLRCSVAPILGHFRDLLLRRSALGRRLFKCSAPLGCSDARPVWRLFLRSTTLVLVRSGCRLLTSLTALVLGRSGPRPLWSPGHSSPWPLRRSAASVPRCSEPSASPSLALGRFLISPGARSLQVCQSSTHSASTASVLGRSSRPVPVLGGFGLGNSGARPHLAENRRFLFTCMHLLLLLIAVVIVIAIIVSSSNPSLPFLPFSGG